MEFPVDDVRSMKEAPSQALKPATSPLKTSALIIAYVLGLGLLLTLGGWQIARGQHKAAVLESANAGTKDYHQISALPDNPTQLSYQTATLRGNWLEERIILLANRIYQSQLGYEVIMPFRLGDGNLMLVNRGWVQQGQENNLPALQQEQPPKGTLYLPQKGFTLGQAIQTEEISSAQWPKVSLYIDLSQFSVALNETLSPLMLVLDAEHTNSLTRIWKPVVIQPERHYAYALQWFGLAIAFIIFGVIWFRRLRANGSLRYN